MPRSNDDNHRVVPSSLDGPKGGMPPAGSERVRQGDQSILLSLAKLERDYREEDYRQRMILNVLAFNC